MSTYTGVTNFQKQSGFLAHPVVCVTETIPGQAMLKFAQASPVMSMYCDNCYLCKATYFLSPIHFVPSLYYAFFYSGNFYLRVFMHK